MTNPVQDRSELYLRFTRQSMIALLFVVVVLGGTALSLILSPAGAIRRSENLLWWLLPIAIALSVAVPVSIRRRRWAPDAPEVRAVMQDEWQRTIIDRATRAALIVVLSVQWPLAMILGFWMQLHPPRLAAAMAWSTITLGVATFLTLCLLFDRE